MGDQLLSKVQVCEMLRISLSALNRLMANGHISSIKMGKKCVRFTREDVEACVRGFRNNTK